MSVQSPRCDEMLVALRRVMRAVDLHSRRLIRSHGLTTPQALILKVAASGEALPAGKLARQVSLSQATVTDILNRLEARGLVRRIRSSEDKRQVMIEATPAGRQLMLSSPPLLQERFADRFGALQDWEQSMLVASLQRIAALMDVADMEVAPVLSGADLTAVPDVQEARPACA